MRTTNWPLQTLKYLELRVQEYRFHIMELAESYAEAGVITPRSVDQAILADAARGPVKTSSDLGHIIPKTAAKPPCPCLSTVLASYFTRHIERPRGDQDTVAAENFHQGEWVMARVNEALESILEQVVCEAPAKEDE